MAKKTTNKAEVKTAVTKNEPEVKAEVKAPAVKAETKAAPAKTAAKKPAEKTAPAAKAAPKAAAKPAAKAKAPAAAAEAPKKRGGRKPKPVTIDDICAKLAKKVNKAKAAKITATIAVDVQVWGWEDGSQKHLFVELKDGNVRVEPYDYNGSNFNAYISFADAVAVVDGKLSIKDAVFSGKLNAIGVVGDALTLASIFD